MNSNYSTFTNVKNTNTGTGHEMALRVGEYKPIPPLKKVLPHSSDLICTLAASQSFLAPLGIFSEPRIILLKCQKVQSNGT